MLEEALSSTTYSPAEAALTFISFLEVELAAGGPAAEARFFKLFSMLCDRVFGVLSKDDKFKHQIGGWLSRHARWERPNMSLPSSRTSPHHRIPHRTATSSTSSIKSDPVVQLLGPRAVTNASPGKAQQQPLTLIEALAKEAEHRPNVRYPFPFEAFPKSTQAAWTALIDAGLGAPHSSQEALSENCIRLLGSLFRVKPLEQISLRQYQQSKVQEKVDRRPLQLSPMQFQNRTPISPMALQGNIPTKEKESHPTISLSMLEYYLVVFIRYPLAPPPAQAATPQPKSTTRPGVPVAAVRRTSEPYGDTVYYQLFQEYVDYYIPYSFPSGQSRGFAPMERPSELFVRIVIEFWLEGQNPILATAKSIKAFQERRGTQVPIDLNTSFDLIKTNYDPPPFQITRCLHKLITRAVTDGAIHDLSRDMAAGYKGANPNFLCLSPTMTFLQLPFFNYINSAFRHASIHAMQSPFYAALNDWLVWLEPWNTRHEKSRVQSSRIMTSQSTSGSLTGASRVIYPKATQRSVYSDHWEPYIAANLHLYTVPLALFLRRSRELDFSPREYQRSLNTVRRVFRVFSPHVVAVINKLCQQDPTSKWTPVVKSHEQNLGPFVPYKGERGLASCQDDMQNLLEEIHLQHLKKVDNMDFIDRLIAKLENPFGGGVMSGEEKELKILVGQAKVVVGFPNDFDIPSKSRAASDAQSRGRDVDSGVDDRSSSGYFSEFGRGRISTGSTKCNPLEIGYVGDRMYRRPGSYENPFLVRALVSLSVFLNTQLGLEGRSDEKGFDYDESLFPRRINLRFLADVRNLVFVIVCYALKKLIWG